MQEVPSIKKMLYNLEAYKLSDNHKDLETDGYKYTIQHQTFLAQKLSSLLTS